LYGKYVKFQTAFQNRIKYLQSGGDSNLQFETPDAPNGDKCMPSLLIKYSSKLKSGQPQPDENYVRGGSCAFDAARIEAYQKANSTFKTDMTQSGEVSLPKLRDLLAMDLAYIHLRSIKWKAKKPAHLGSGGAADDDDPPANQEGENLKEAAPGLDESDETSAVIPLRDDYDFMKWDITDPAGIPWKELTFTLSDADRINTKRGDLPHYFLPAMCIATHAIISSNGSKVSEELKGFYDRCSPAVESASGQTVRGFLGFDNPEYLPGKDWQQGNKKRDYTDEEMEYIDAIWTTTRDVCLADASETPSDQTSTKEPAEANDRRLRSSDPAPLKEDASKIAAPASAGNRIKAVAVVKKRVGIRDAPVRVERVVTSDGRKGGKHREGRKRAVEEGPDLAISEKTKRILVGQVSQPPPPHPHPPSLAR
jgi:hypothetical protein